MDLRLSLTMQHIVEPWEAPFRAQTHGTGELIS